MENLTTNHLFIILGIIAIALEMFIGVATGFDLVIIGSIFILAGISGMLFGGVLTPFVVVVLLTLVYFFSVRNIIKKKLKVDLRPTNTEGIIGKRGVVTKAISKQQVGQVKVEGELWRASADVAIAEGEDIVVESVSGVTLQVRAN